VYYPIVLKSGIGWSIMGAGGRRMVEIRFAQMQDGGHGSDFKRLGP